MDEALGAFESDEKVEVSFGDRYIFEPVEEDLEVGFIIYPGERVDPSYPLRRF